LAALGALGLRVSVDRLENFRTDFRALARLGVRFAKIDAGRLLGADPASAGDIHPADLAPLAARAGVVLVAAQVESEAEVVDLLDFRLRYAQGNLFAPPRRVRLEPVPRPDGGPEGPYADARPKRADARAGV